MLVAAAIRLSLWKSPWQEFPQGWRDGRCSPVNGRSVHHSTGHCFGRASCWARQAVIPPASWTAS